MINAVTDTGKTLTPYHYIAVGTVAASPFAKTANDTISTFLRNAGQVSGKRCYAFLGKQGLRKGRVLSSLMKKMESEGMYLKRSDVLSRAEEAKAVGARLHLDKSVN